MAGLLVCLLVAAAVFLVSCAGREAPASFLVPGASEPAAGNAAVAAADDHHTLLSFRSLVRGDPSRALVSWTSGGNGSAPPSLLQPLCQWRGVKCGTRGRRRGRVVALDLPELGLLGELSPALGNLTYLRRLRLRELRQLDLSNNSIQGRLPPSLSSCGQLRSILLHGNKLQGEIPGEFGSLGNLEVLNLGQNRLTGNIPPHIASLANLKLLVVEFNNLTGEIPPHIGNLVNLVGLGLGSNQLSGYIPASLGNLSALTALDASSNNLAGSIPPLQDLSSLSSLYLGENKLEGTIPEWIGNLSSLTSLNLQSNGLVGHIPDSLGNLQLLEAVSFADNRLVGPIPDAIGNLHALTELYPDNNELEGPLPLSVFNLSSLEMLNIQSNNFTGGFPPDMGNKMSNLQQFLVSKNQFHGVIPPSLCNASMLEMIQTVDNFLTGTIPRCLGARQEMLSVVNFVGNQLEATNDDDGWGFLTSLTNCSNMILLDVSINKLQGVLPKSIGNLSTQLEFLGVASNNITGTITEAIGDLINLDELDMDNNLLKGTIPESLCKLKKLNQLSLSNNNLSGSMPVTLGNLTKLTTPLLDTNTLSGAIPSTLGNCPLETSDLSYNNLSGPTPKEPFLISTLSSSMYLAHNSLTGTLPSEVGNLKNLGELDLSDNMISGKIPTAIGDCESLQYLNISENLLDGTIPQSLGQLRGLLVLDLSQNNLSGSIPVFLGSLKGLATLNLSFNDFEGEVPKDGIFLNATATSIMGNNGLCGGVPELKLKICSNHTRNKVPSKLVIVIATGCAFLFTVLVAVFVLCKRSKLRRANPQMARSNEKHVRVSYAELAKATEGFTSENLIGVGSFGTVYKGKMEISGKQVVIAVKVLDLQQSGASRSFDAECEALRCIRYRNLVKIITVCSSIDSQGVDFKALVYEFLPNGNLDQWLHKHLEEHGEPKVLDLIERLQIAMDVASALDYLHHQKPFPVVHCDLKPSNILLDNNMVAHVGDFGLARFLHEEHNSENLTSRNAIRGTIGYVAPEHGLGNEASIHGDVYSYGILLLEMFTGKRPTNSEFGETLNLHKRVQMVLPDQPTNVIDQDLLKAPSEASELTEAEHLTFCIFPTGRIMYARELAGESSAAAKVWPALLSSYWEGLRNSLRSCFGGRWRQCANDNEDRLEGIASGCSARWCGLPEVGEMIFDPHDIERLEGDTN